jgi:hypothetical protein
MIHGSWMFRILVLGSPKLLLRMCFKDAKPGITPKFKSIHLSLLQSSYSPIHLDIIPLIASLSRLRSDS